MLAEDDDRVRFQNMALPDDLAINSQRKFGTVKTGIAFRQAHPLEAEIKTSKKTQPNAESVLVTPAGFEPAIFWMRTRYPNH